MLDKLGMFRRDWLQWRSLLGLAALQAAIALTWVVYNAYLVQLLGRFGFPASWATNLLVVESCLAVVLEPVMGWLSDRTANRANSTLSPDRWVASRFPFITIGTILAAVCFMLTALIATGVNPQPAMTWILPVVIIAWAMCMSIFQSPAVALIGQYASRIKLPQATSILLIAAVFVRIFGASSTQLILSWGPVAAFAIGSLSLLTAAFLLARLHPHAAPPPDQSSDQSLELAPRLLDTSNLGLIFAVGCGVGLLGRSISAMLAGQLMAPGISLLLVWTGVQALVLVPVGLLANQLETRRTLFSGLGVVAVVLLTMLGHSDQMAGLVGLTVILGIAYSFVGVATFPFALDRVPHHRSGLGIGLYFSGVALAGTLFGEVLQYLGKPSLAQAALIGIAGVVVACTGAVASLRR
jgi:MFS family permease